MTQPTASELADELETLDTALPAGPWTLWTSCSYRRIGGPTGADGDVLHAYLQLSDNHPDLSMPEKQLRALVALRNRLPTILSALRQVALMKGLLAEVIDHPYSADCQECAVVQDGSPLRSDIENVLGRQALTGEAQ